MNQTAKDLLGKALLPWLGGGAGIAIAWKALSILESQPQLLGDVMKSWGPLFGLGALSILVVHVNFSRGIKAIGHLAGTQEKLTSVIEQSQNTRARENELVLDSMAANFTELLNAQRDMRDEMKVLVIEVGKLKGRAGVE